MAGTNSSGQDGIKAEFSAGKSVPRAGKDGVTGLRCPATCLVHSLAGLVAVPRLLCATRVGFPGVRRLTRPSGMRGPQTTPSPTAEGQQGLRSAPGLLRSEKQLSSARPTPLPPPGTQFRGQGQPGQAVTALILCPAPSWEQSRRPPHPLGAAPVALRASIGTGPAGPPGPLLGRTGTTSQAGQTLRPVRGRRSQLGVLEEARGGEGRRSPAGRGLAGCAWPASPRESPSWSPAGGS